MYNAYVQPRTPEEEAAAQAAYNARYAEERRVLAAKIQATTQLIADIGEALTADPDSNVPVVYLKIREGNEHGNNLPTLETQGDTYGLHFSYARTKPEKLHISGTSWPTYTNRHGNVEIMFPYQAGAESPTITVTESRGAAKIAQEIKRRLLPDLMKAWETCKDKVDSTNATNSQMYATAASVAQILGEKPPSRSNNGYEDGVMVYGNAATVNVCGQYSTFTIRTTDPDHAAIVARHAAAAHAEYIAFMKERKAQTELHKETTLCIVPHAF
jgi:hypothetical protein